MSQLFDVADVVNGDTWAGPDGSRRGFGMPYDIQYDAVARPLIVQDICNKSQFGLIAGPNNAAKLPAVYTIRPFGAMVSAFRPNRCLPGQFPEFEASIHKDLKAEAHRVAEAVLYGGIPGWDSTVPYLLNTDVLTISSLATVQDTAPAVLDAWWAGQVGQRPVLHMGQTAAVKISAGNALSPKPESQEFFLAMDGTPIVVSPEYPTNLVAATGPITVHISEIGDLVPAYDYGQNRTYFTTVLAMSIEFDASIAVRAT